MDLLTEIINCGSELQSRYPIYDRAVISRVTGVLGEELKKNDLKIELTRAHVDKMKESLIIRGNAKSDRTLLHWACFNDLRFELAMKINLTCPSIVIQNKKSRNLIMNSYDQLLNDIVPVQSLHDYLLNLPPFNNSAYSGDDYTKDEAIDYICSFIASALIFGKVSFQSFQRAFTQLRIKDVSINPCFINLRFTNSETYFRYFLPFPASAYLYRCLLFYNSQYRSTFKRKCRKADDLIFQPIVGDSGKVIFDVSSGIMPIFKKWLHDKLLRCNYDPTKLRVDSFRKASIAWSTLNSLSVNDTKIKIPLCLLSVGSRRINSYSFRNDYLFHLCPELKNSLPVKRRNNKLTTSGELYVDQSLEPVINEILTKLDALGRRPKYLTRLKAAENILLIINLAILDDENIYNVTLYADWVCSMLQNKGNRKIRTSIQQATMVPKILHIIAQAGKKISDYTPEELTIISNQIPHKTFVSAFNRFDKYLKKTLGDDYQSPNLKRRATKTIPSFKPLVDFNDIKSVVAACDNLFPTQFPNKGLAIYVYGDTETLTDFYSKAETLKHVIQIAFYTGMRIEEITDLSIGNVFYDEGFWIAVRGDRKTPNSIRNIPLSLLAPHEYINEFEKFMTLKRSMFSEPWHKLFVVSEGNILHNLDPVQTSNDIRRVFTSINRIDITTHHLRHAFANWFLLRWFTVFHRDQIPDDTPFLNYDLFRDDYLDNLCYLLLGEGRRRSGQNTFNYALAALARLMGHGGPIITLEAYVHVIDWIFYCAIKTTDNSKPIAIKIEQLVNFCQVSDRTIRNLSKKHKDSFANILPSRILEYQRLFI